MRRAGPIRLGLVLLVVAVAVAAPAPAAAASRVVLLRAPGDDPLTQQGNTLLAAELSAAGFEVVTAERRAGRDIRRDIEAASEAALAVATFAILPDADGAAVELWLEDRVTGKLVIRRIRIDRSREVAADLALRAVELLRGSLLEVTVPRAAGAAEAAPPEDVARWVSNAAPARALYFSGGVGVAAGASALGTTGLGATFAPTVRLSWGTAGGLVARLTLSGMGFARTLRRAEGTAQVRQDLALVEVARVFRPGARLQPFAGAGAGVHRLRSDGTGVSPLFPGGAKSDEAVVVALGGGVAARLGDRVALVGDASLVAIAPRTQITIAGSEVGRAGGAGVTATVALAATF